MPPNTLPLLHRAATERASLGGSGFRRALDCIDTHCGGQPARIVVGGMPDLPGSSVFDKMLHLERHGDALRRLLIFEPRGSPAMMADVIVPSDRAAAGFIILEQTEYPAMSGHNAICTATALLEAGIVPMTGPTCEFQLEAPAGLIGIRARCSDGLVTSVTVDNVPSFAVHLDATIEVPGLGPVVVDVAWGGMFYVLVDAASLGLTLDRGDGARLARFGRMITQAASEQLPCVHPANPAINGVTICCLTSPATATDRTAAGGETVLRAKNAVAISTGAMDWDAPDSHRAILDRSPCGTGTCARMAVLHAKGELPLGTCFEHESITGEVFVGRLSAETRVGELPAVRPSVTGRAWVTGYNTLLLRDDDPFQDGFTVGDVWGEPALRLHEDR